MLICHKLDVSSRAAVLQSMSCVRRASPCKCMQQSAVTVMPASRGCAPLSASSSLIYHFWSLKHHHSAARHHYHRSLETQLSYPWKLHACRANNIYFLQFFFIFCSMYLVLFSIVLYRTIVTVYTDNIFLYNYLRQMHQIINLSQVGCFTPARGKTVQKNRELSGVKYFPVLATIAAKLIHYYTSYCSFFLHLPQIELQ